MQPLRSTEENDNMKVRFAALMSAFFLVVGLPLAAMAGPTPGGPNTGDTDGVENAFDNCTGKNNNDQKDYDHDGCGDQCDADYDQSGSTAGPDYFIFKSAYGSSVGQPAYNPVVDTDCSGTISGPDYFVFKGEYNTTPGPSGVNSNYKGPSCP
jgi:hypothetical protein